MTNFQKLTQDCIKWYNQLISFRKENEPKNCYVEIHHIIPICIGGTNNNENLVKLTAREHYIAHLLLARSQPNNYKLKNAIIMMGIKSKTNQRNFIFNSKLYESIRKKVAKHFSIIFSGNGNPMFGSEFRWITNTITHKNKRVEKTFIIPSSMELKGWIYGIYQKPYKKTNIYPKKNAFRWIKNNRLQKSKQLDKNKQLTNEMIADGWEYGQYQTDKCKQSHEIRKVKIKLDGIEKTIDEWSNILGISKAKIKFRYKKGFKAISDIINPPTHIKSRNGGQKFEVNGKMYSLKELEKLTGIKSTRINARLNRGWPLAKAINPNYNPTKKWIHSLDLNIERLIDKNEQIPLGWLSGRLS